VHDTLADWTGKVDAKASYALTIESGVLAGAVVLSQQGSRPGYPQPGAAGILYAVSVGLLGAGVLTAICVIMPRLTGQKRLMREAPSNFVYFGHLRHWNPDLLEPALRDDSVLPGLSRAIVVMSRCAWRKYRLMQLSLAFSALGAALIVAAQLISLG
jgi:hypothetical protein